MFEPRRIPKIGNVEYNGQKFEQGKIVADNRFTAFESDERYVRLGISKMGLLKAFQVAGKFDANIDENAILEEIETSVNGGANITTAIQRIVDR